MLGIPHPLPDELYSSHKVRACRATGMSPYELARALGDALRVAPRERRWARLLALASGMCERRYVGAHSMLQVLQPVRCSSATVDVRPSSFPNSNLLPWCSRACRQCVERDLRQSGHSWFRRAHHIPGVRFCIEHGCGLIEISDDGLLPEESRDFTRLKPAAVRSILVRRYADICQRQLQIDAPSLTRHIGPRLRERAFQLGIVPHASSWSGLNDYAQRVLPRSWLHSIFDADLLSAANLDVTLQAWQLAAGPVYCLAAALLYDDPAIGAAALCGVRDAEHSPTPS